MVNQATGRLWKPMLAVACGAWLRGTVSLKRALYKYWPFAIIFIVFIVYIPALRLMPFHDDAVLMPAISNRTLITIFENRPYGDGHHRPISYVPWLILRDLYGWFTPAAMHMWNIFVHTLNTALVLALAQRIAKRFGGQKQHFSRCNSADLRALSALLRGCSMVICFGASSDVALWSGRCVRISAGSGEARPVPSR